MRRLGLCLVAVCGAFAWLAEGATYYVAEVAAADDAAGYGLSPEKPFHTVVYAVSKAVDGDTIALASGVYKPTCEVVVDKAVTLQGGAGVVFNGVSVPTTERFLILNHPDAVVDGICFSNKHYTVNNTSAHRYGVAVEVKQGTLRNSVVAKCSYKGYQNHGMLGNEGGVIEDCEVTSCTGDGFYQNYGVGFCQTAGETRRLKVNTCSPVAPYGCGVALKGGVIDGAIIEGNGVDWSTTTTVEGAGAYVSGGELRNSVIRNNRNVTRSAGVYVTGSGVVTNCEIYGNRSTDPENGDAAGMGLVLDGKNAVVTGCTITDNAYAYQPFPDCRVKAGTFTDNTTNAFEQTALVAYVSADGSNDYPYDTPAKAAANVNDALNALSRDPAALTDLYIGEGTFYLDNALILNRGVRVHGAGRDRTVIAGYGGTRNKCRAFYLRDTNALVENLTVSNVWYNYYNESGSGSGARLANGAIRNCLFTKCSIENAYQFATVYMTGGVLSGCEITDAYDKWSYSAKGEGLYLGGGLATNCVIHGNTRSQYAANGGHGVYVNGGTLDACVVTNNGVRTDSNVNGSGLRLVQGAVRNSLIAGNFSKTGTAGVYIDAGVFENNTVVGNVTASDTTGQSGVTVNGAAAIVRNNIFYGNGPEGGSAGSVNLLKGTLQTNIVDKAVAGVGNIVANPALDSAYRPGLGSPAIDNAAPVAEVDHDLEGVARPNGEASDIGCYEFDWSKVGFTAKISISQSDYPADGETPAVATAVVVGAPGEVIYAGSLDDGEAPVSTEAQFSSADLAPGRHALRLVVTSGSSVSEDTNAEAFTIRPFTTYASPDGSNTFPYDTRVKAARCLNDAVAALWNGSEVPTVVRVGEGVVSVRETLNIQGPVKILGEGADKSALDGGYAGHQGFVVNHPDARLEGLCISNFSYAAQAEKGKGAGVVLNAGTVCGCRITGCRTKGAYQSGTAAHVAGGLLASTEIDRCQTDWEYECHGGAVYQTGGTVSNCWIHALIETRDFTPNNNDGGLAAGVTAGLMTHCLIESNVRTKAAPAGIVSVSGTGVVRNTILRDNQSTTGPAGFVVKGGRVEHCTVVGNNATSASAGLSGLVQTGGTVVNSIFYANGLQYTSLGSCNVTGGTFQNNVTDLPVATGVDCYATDPMFADAAARDYHLKLGSPAIDRALVLENVAVDYDGVERPQGEASDIGAFEYVSAGGPLSCGIAVTTVELPLGAALSATATVEGADLEGLAYAWYLDGALTGADTAEFAAENVSAGYHDLKLVVRNESGEVAEASMVRAFNVHPFVTYASVDGTGEYPYDTPAKATTDVAAAFDAIWSGETESVCVLHIAPGAYELTGALNLARPVSVVGAGRDLVVLDGAGLTTRAAMLSSEGARMEHLTVSNVCNNAIVEGAAVYLSAGTLRDVRVTACKSSIHYAKGVALYQTGGLAEGCELVDNAIEGAQVDVCGIGALVSGGILRNSRICGNRCTETRVVPAKGFGFRQLGGLVENVVICSNAVPYSLAENIRPGIGAAVLGGTLRNALVFANEASGSVDGFGLYVDGPSAEIVNVTCVGHRGTALAAAVNEGRAVNCLLAENEGGDLMIGAYASISYSRWSECTSTRNGNMSADPKFRRSSKGDFRLKLCSPCVDAGDTSVWEDVDGATDLAGDARIVRARVDIGAFEQSGGGLLLFVR